MQSTGKKNPQILRNVSAKLVRYGKVLGFIHGYTSIFYSIMANDEYTNYLKQPLQELVLHESQESRIPYLLYNGAR